MDAGLPADTVKLFRQRGREQIGKPVPERMLPRNSAELFDLRIPAFDPIFQIRRQNPYIDRFNDILAEFLETFVLLYFALEGAIQSGILDCDTDIARQGDQ
jgi:hypothetical protein